LLAAVLGGCESDHHSVPSERAATPQPTTPPLASPPSGALQHGYFAGTVAIEGNPRYAEALLAANGAIRIYVGGSSGKTFDPDGSVLIIAQLESDGDQTLGTGTAMGQHCALFPGPFCAAPAPVELQITDTTQGYLYSDVRVLTASGIEAWALASSWPTSTYLEPATIQFAAGQYEETLAEFGQQERVTINVDDDGTIFFQSATTGCVGNGELAPHQDGEFNVYDATLTIENCTGAYAYLNSELEGIANRSIGICSSWLVIWLASPDDQLSPVAVTMWASDLSAAGCWDY